MSFHVLEFDPFAYRGAHISADKVESQLCLHFDGPGTAAEVLKTLRRIVQPAAPQPKPEPPKEIEPDTSAVVRALDEDQPGPDPEPEPLLSIPSMEEMLGQLRQACGL